MGWWVSWPRSCTSTFTSTHLLKKGALCVPFARSGQGNFILKSANSYAHFAIANLQISFSFQSGKKCLGLQIHNLQIRKSQKILGSQIANPQSAHLRKVRKSNKLFKICGTYLRTAHLLLFQTLASEPITQISCIKKMSCSRQLEEEREGAHICRTPLKGAQVWDSRSLRFSLFLHHKAFLGRWLCG